MEYYTLERAKKSIRPRDLNDFLDNIPKPERKNWICEEKFDGARYALYIRKDGNKLFSKSWSVVTGKPVDKTNNVPHLTKFEYPKELHGVVLDLEAVMPGNKSSETTKIMGCNSEKAVERQKELGLMQFQLLDVLFSVYSNGKIVDIRGCSDTARRSVGCAILKAIAHTYIMLPKRYLITKAKSVFNKILARGGEGIMIKDTTATYGYGWFKVKKKITCDVIITGYLPGNGKYEGQVGSLKFSLWDSGKLVECGRCSGMDDKTRLYISNNIDKLIKKKAVIEVEGQEFTSGKRLRHPEFIRFREDKSDIDCKWNEQLNDRWVKV